MRGATSDGIVGIGGARIIPADAGSTLTHIRQDALEEDHPRGCGEHLIKAAKPLSCKGSSPRMRGAHSQRISAIRPDRIIPADAGSTEAVCRPGRPPEDHPRGCGEHAAPLP